MLVRRERVSRPPAGIRDEIRAARRSSFRLAALCPSSDSHPPMHPNAALIQRFYAAFAARDAAGMQACYHPDVVFRDPVFGELRTDEP